jgi:8-oxo-dGTP pyrophosphatase MutT (NUDIX family)
MNPVVADPGLLSCREKFLSQATEKLGIHPSDFQSETEIVEASVNTATPRQAAAVLLPILFRETRISGEAEGKFVFQLIKRSSRVSQPGDLSCPGGMLHPILDRLIAPLLIYGPFKMMRGHAGACLSRREPALRRIMGVFIANALRESWEEIRLSPFRVHFLGPLPTYSLKLFRRTIFPVAGFVEKPGTLRPNREVEKIIEIPIESFFQKDLIGCHTLFFPDSTGKPVQRSPPYPCLIHHEPDGAQEILWGATFHILVNFLSIVMDYRLPDWEKGPLIQREMRSDYLTSGSGS